MIDLHLLQQFDQLLNAIIMYKYTYSLFIKTVNAYVCMFSSQSKHNDQKQK